MSTIVTRAEKGSPLSWVEADANFVNLNTDKLEATDLAGYETSSHAASTYATLVALADKLDTTGTAADSSKLSGTTPTTAGLALLDDATAADQRTTLGLGTAATANSGDFQAADADIPTIAASQVEMETGTESALRSMSPLRVQQAISALSGIGSTPSLVRVNTSNGHGSTNTKIRRFTTTVTSQGTDITYADSASLGASFTINTTGVYSISYTDIFNAQSVLGISLDSSQLTTGIQSITAADRLAIVDTNAANYSDGTATTLALTAGAVVRPHTNGAADSASAAFSQFTIQRVA